MPRTVEPSSERHRQNLEIAAMSRSDREALIREAAEVFGEAATQRLAERLKLVDPSPRRPGVGRPSARRGL